MHVCNMPCPGTKFVKVFTNCAKFANKNQILSSKLKLTSHTCDYFFIILRSTYRSY